jgi:hypothetical protein
MRWLAVLAAMCALCPTARAETQDCKTITDPALRLTCYDRLNPPVATYPIPLPKPSASLRGTPASQEPSQVESNGYVDSLSEEDSIVNARMHGICRGC